MVFIIFIGSGLKGSIAAEPENGRRVRKHLDRYPAARPSKQPLSAL
jgi:hypothetical protein